MTNSIPEIKPWQIRIGYVAFSDRPNKGKARPILIVDVTESYAYCLKITSTGESKTYPRIKLDHESLGLPKPSWLQLAPLHRVSVNDIDGLVSNVSPEFAKMVSLNIEL